MYCPVCRDVDMHEVTKEGVLIDVCPRCRGVWLDRGELEKILAAGRAAHKDYDEVYGEKDRINFKSPQPHEGIKHHDHKYEQNYGHYKHKHHKKKPLYKILEDIFD